MILALVLAVQATVGPAMDAGPAHEIVKLDWDARAKLCGAQVHGAQIGDPTTEEGQAALVRALPDRQSLVHLIGTTEVPFACAQGAVEALQKSGRRYRVGFASEPPLPRY